MQPTAQKNNAKQRKTIAIVAVIAVVAIALAAVAIIAVANKREMTQAASDTCTLNAKALGHASAKLRRGSERSRRCGKTHRGRRGRRHHAGNPEGCDHAGRSRGKRANMPRERQCQRLHQGDRRYSHVRRPTCATSPTNSTRRQVGDRQPGTQTRVRQISRPSQTSRQGAAPSSATPAFKRGQVAFSNNFGLVKDDFRNVFTTR